MKQKLHVATLAGILAAAALFTGCFGADDSGKTDPNAQTEQTEPDTTGEENHQTPAKNLTDYISEVYNLNNLSYTASVSDMLEVGNAASENQHALTLSGAVKTKMVAATGTRSDEYSVIAFSKKGDSAQWIMDLSNPAPKDANEPFCLEIREIHEAVEQGFSYSVLVEGKEVYFRTYEQIASAPNQYFIKINRNEINDPASVAVKIVAKSNTSFAISKVWGYSDFSSLASEQKTYQNIGLNLYGANTVQTGYEKISPYLNQNYNTVDLGVAFRLDYFNMTVEKAMEQIKSYVSAAEGWNTDLQIMPAMYWSGSPYATDGLGGNFSDSKYSQVLYNSKTGEYYDTTPNVYSSTNWVTTGNDVLNQAAVTKINAIFTEYADFLAAHAAEKTDIPNIELVMEWGVCYKGIGTMTGVSQSGALDGGDFNVGLIEKAALAGVTLDPSNGLSYTEKKWLTDWHAEYNQMLADAYHKALGRNAITVKNGIVDLPVTQQSDHIFSHNVEWMNQNPSHDLRISGWMSGIGDGFYSSSEDMYFDDVRYYQYKTAYGRTGCVNLEMAIHNDSDIFLNYMRQSFEEGLEFVTIYNDKEEYNTYTTVKKLDWIANATAAAPAEYRVNLVNLDFCRDAAIPDYLACAAGIQSFTRLAHNTNDGNAKMTEGGTSSLLLKVTDAGRKFENGLCVDLQAKLNSLGDSVKVYVGDTAESQTYVATFNWSGTQAVDRFNANHEELIDLTSATQNKSEVYIRIDLISASGSVTLQSAKVYLNNETATGQKNGIKTTAKQRRIENLWISKRAVTERMLEAYSQKADGENAVTKAAEELMAKGYYTTAYEMLSGMYSQLLPATYVLTGNGTLGCYPVSMTPSRKSMPVTVVLTSAGDAGYAFSANAQRAITVETVFSGLSEGSRWVLTKGENNTFALIPAESGTTDVLVAQNGEIKVTLDIKTVGETKTYPITVTGRVFADFTSASLQVSVQDPAISCYSESVTLPVANSCTFTRHADGSADVQTGTAAKPKKGDGVILTFNGEGTEIIQIESVYGLVSGKIVSVVAPDPQSGINGSITLENGKSYELEYNKYTTKIEIGTVNAYARTLHSYEIAAVIAVGKQVTVSYCPDTVNGSLPRMLSITDK